MKRYRSLKKNFVQFNSKHYNLKTAHLGRSLPDLNSAINNLNYFNSN